MYKNRTRFEAQRATVDMVRTTETETFRTKTLNALNRKCAPSRDQSRGNAQIHTQEIGGLFEQFRFNVIKRG